MKISEILRDKLQHAFTYPLSMIKKEVRLMWCNRVLCCTILCCLFGFSFVFPPLGTSPKAVSEQELNVNEQHWEKKFHQQINLWISEIGHKGSQFEDWLKARYETYPLGPGSRQWVVLIYDQHQEIGYLIMEQTNDEPRFSLIEYGKSEPAILSKEIQEKELQGEENLLETSFFYHGLLWAKVEDNCLVDLITLEKYEHVPLENVEPSWKGEEVSHLLLEKKMNLHHAHPILFLADARGNPNKISPVNLKETEHYFFQARLLPNVTGLYHVVAVHTWSDLENSNPKHFFIGLEDEGIRFFSSAYLEELGTFERIEVLTR